MKKKAATKQSAPTQRKASAIRHMQSDELVTPAPSTTQLFDRVAAILDQARANVVRAVNSQMVLAYWLIGREIVQELQGGKERAAYGKRVLEGLSGRLNERYGSGFSVANLQNFRQFYLVYETRPDGIHYPMGSEFVGTGKSRPVGAELTLSEAGGPASDESLVGFSPQLNWSHYRALMRVENGVARDFYELEAIAGGWDKRTLERQIHSFYHIQSRFYLLIDLKIGKLTHQDVGQMDGYVRIFDDLCLSEGDNPTIGLILCTEKNEAVAKYSVLKDRKQIFASKYMLYLPTEEELCREIERERRLIEEHAAARQEGER